jgi:hypothetical protein
MIGCYCFFANRGYLLGSVLAFHSTGQTKQTSPSCFLSFSKRINFLSLLTSSLVLTKLVRYAKQRALLVTPPSLPFLPDSSMTIREHSLFHRKSITYWTCILIPNTNTFQYTRCIKNCFASKDARYPASQSTNNNVDIYTNERRAYCSPR